MKLKPILAAFAVTLSALASTAMAVETFTQDAAGNLTHVRGIPVDPIQTPEEARINAEKHIAAMKAKEAAQAAAKHATRNPLPATAPQELFFTGKPYLEETGQYLFLFRHYDPELARWTTADPSGFPDGANNWKYLTDPLAAFDWQGLVEVKLNIEIFAAQKTYHWLWGSQWTDINVTSESAISADSTSSVAAAVKSNQSVEWMHEQQQAGASPFLSIELFNNQGASVASKSGYVWGTYGLAPSGHALLVYGDRAYLPSDRTTMYGGSATVLVRYEGKEWNWSASFIE